MVKKGCYSLVFIKPLINKNRIMAFSNEEIQAIWEKGTIVLGKDPRLWRKDQCDALIKRDKYGDRSSIWGWEVDHITAVSNGGRDTLSNLRPLQWMNNASRQNGRLVCVVGNVQ